MIPRHRPPFRTPRLLRLFVRSLSRPQQVTTLEHAYEKALDVPHAVWLPSARYGITRAIQLALPSDGVVACPAFNCGAVYHAVSETGRSVKYRDITGNQFLMDVSGVALPRCAVVLSEIFGDRFTSSQLQQPFVQQADMRVFDLAMGIAERTDIQRMKADDVTVVSFGLGKSLFAGWGGLALTYSEALAAELRQRRDRDLQHPGLWKRIKSEMRLLARTWAHDEWCYGWLRSASAMSATQPVSGTQPLDGFTATSYEWHRPPTSLHVECCLHNLQIAEFQQEKRRQVVQWYRQSLVGCGPVIRLPGGESSSGLSHFSVRVPPDVRDVVRRRLWKDGIDTGTLFPSPVAQQNSQRFPHASAAAAEVINLPVSPEFSEAAVARICESLKASLSLGAVIRTPSESERRGAARQPADRTARCKSQPAAGYLTDEQRAA